MLSAMPIPIDAPSAFFIANLGVWSFRSARALQTLFWAPRLKPPAKIPEAGKVSILVPAKNEEVNIRTCVESLLAQNYADFELIVINDNSTDRTLDILLELGAVPADQPAGKSTRLRYVNSPPAPPGWTGKNHALACGAPFAKGDWLLFTDADTVHEPSCVSAALTLMAEKSVVLLTLLPRCLAHGFWEVLVQPFAMSLMGLWFPVRKANDPRSRIAFGNGQFLFMHRRAYEAAGGHLAVKSEFLEDFALFRKVKEAGLPCAVGIGTDLFGTRMYDAFQRLWRGWRRIYLHAFERRPLPLVLRALGLVFFSVLPFVWLAGAAAAAFSGSEFPLPAGLWAAAGAALALAASWKAYEVIGASRKFAWLHPLAALVIAGILLDAARMAALKKQTKWR